jgi:HAD superfamily hydrolase (TIGR01490 family)
MVFFDVDHTITRHSTGRRFAEYGREQGIFRWYELLRFPLFYLRYRLGLVGARTLGRQVTPVAGRTRGELEEIGDGCFEKAILPDMYREAVDHIRELQRAGTTVGLATTSLDILVAPMARYLNIDIVLATGLEYRDGLSTGRTIDAPCFGREKRRRVLDYLHHEGISPAQCGFYSDSKYDLPLLEAVGEPVAVNPDRGLRRRAQRANWSIRHFRS